MVSTIGFSSHLKQTTAHVSQTIYLMVKPKNEVGKLIATFNHFYWLIQKLDCT